MAAMLQLLFLVVVLVCVSEVDSVPLNKGRDDDDDGWKRVGLYDANSGNIGNDCYCKGFMDFNVTERERQRMDVLADRCYRPMERTRREIGHLSNNTFFWLHAPKCGTSFQNTIYHLGCDKFPLELGIANEDGNAWDLCMRNTIFVSCYRYIIESCRVILVYSEENPNKILTHPSIKEFHPHKINYVGLFREPKRRLISAYHYHLTGCVDCDRCISLIDFVNYNQVNRSRSGPAGVYVRMLTGSHFDGLYPNENEIQLAESRISKFAFVGLVEEWDISICIFHFKFGYLPTIPSTASNSNLIRTPQYYEFYNSRKGEYQLSSAHHNFLLNDAITDTADQRIYTIATYIFNKQIQEYQITSKKFKNNK